jgi:hypothetical protein
VILQMGNRFSGLEVKAGSSVSPADFSGLRRLRELSGRRFHGFTEASCFMTETTLCRLARDSLAASGQVRSPVLRKPHPRESIRWRGCIRRFVVVVEREVHSEGELHRSTGWIAVLHRMRCG